MVYIVWDTLVAVKVTLDISGSPIDNGTPGNIQGNIDRYVYCKLLMWMVSGGPMLLLTHT